MLIISHSHKACKKITKKVAEKFGGFMGNAYLCTRFASMKIRVARRRGYEHIDQQIKQKNSKTMDVNIEDLCAWAGEARRELVRDIEQMKDTLMQRQKMVQALELFGSLVRENESLREQLNDERRQRAELEMHLAELSKLSAGVAKKASQEELLKALRTYINISKRKTFSKRTAVKMMIMELASTVGLVFPEDVGATLDSLDDEQPEPLPTTINVAAGGINVQQANTVKK